MHNHAHMNPTDTTPTPTDTTPTPAEKAPRKPRTSKKTPETTPASQEQEQSAQAQSFHYFLVVGQVEYCESRHNKAAKSLLVNAIFRSNNAGIVAKDLAAVQTRLQLSFHQKFSKTHKEPPHEITDVVITGTSYLGTFTEAEFMANAPGVETPAPAPVAPPS